MADKPTVYRARPLDTTAGTTTNIDFSAELTYDHESEAPLTTLLSKLKDEPVLTHVFKFAVERFAPRTSTANGAVPQSAVAASATLTVATNTGVYFLEGDVIEFPDTNVDATHTNQCIVTDVSGDTLTLKGFDPATYGVASIDDGATIRVISSAMKEGSSGRTSRQTVPTVYTAACQTFEDYFDVTRLQSRNRQYTEPERARLREEIRKKHVMDHEYAYLLMKGLSSGDVTSGGTAGGATGKPRYQLPGLISQISTNLLTYGASLDKTELFDFMTDVHAPMYSGGIKRLVLASSDLLASINNMATDSIRITTKESTWGPSITEMQFAGRIWSFVEAPVLSEARQGWGVVIHPGFLKKRTFWSTMYEMNVQNPVDKFYKDGFYSVSSLEVRLEEVFGLIRP